MLSQAFHVRCVGVGALFRGERGARWPAARRRGSRGDGSRLGRDADIGQSGWLLDGFPCTVSQAEALLDDQWSTLRPDAVVLIERQDELVREVALGRRAAATGAGPSVFDLPVSGPPPARSEGPGPPPRKKKNRSYHPVSIQLTFAVRMGCGEPG